MTVEEKLSAAHVATVCQYRGKVVDKLEKWLNTRDERDFKELIAQHEHSKKAEDNMRQKLKERKEKLSQG